MSLEYKYGDMGRVNRIFENEEYQKYLKRLTFLEQDREFCCHTIGHFLDTARIMYIISLEESLNFPKDIIYAAAILHDIGRVMQYEENIPHEKASAQIARKLLPMCGYGKSESESIVHAILSHRSKDSEVKGSLGELLYRADKLTRLCFDCKASGECYWEQDKRNHFIIY